MPRYKPLGPTLSQELDDALDAEWREELKLTESREKFDAAKERRRISLRDVDPYADAASPHSYFVDRALASLAVPDREAVERLNRYKAASEKQRRSVGTSTLGGIVSVVPLWAAESLAQAVRSAAPLYDALLKIPLPPQGVTVNFSKYTAGDVATVQTSESTALTEGGGTPPAISFVSEPFSTVATYVDYSFQAADRGAIVDEQMAVDIGSAWATKVESELWVGTGSAGRVRGLTQMSGLTSVAAGGQTLANNLGAIWNCYQQTTMALGRPPDLLVVHPRRSAWWAQAVAGAPANFVPDGVALVESPSAPSNLGGGSEDHPFLVNRAAVPLATDGPQITFQTRPRGTELVTRVTIHGYLAFATAVRPEGAGKVTALTTPTFS
jgi:hypothetical protein